MSEDDAALTKLEFGSYYDLDLKQDEGKWLYTHHIAENTFKIISLMKYGQLTIYVNETDLSRATFKDIRENNIKLSEFKFKTSYKNTLLVKPGEDGFCSDCHYLIYVQADRDTKTTIFLGSESTKVSLHKDKILFDELHTENTTTLATFTPVSAGDIMVKVHAGTIQVELSYRED